ncbi:MAG: hypothetical protein ACM3XM_09635 [Mycobacterium leprae]
MFDKRMDERAFLQSVGLDPDNLDWLVKDAPPVAADVRERIRRRVQAKIDAPAPAVIVPAPGSRRWRFARVATAAALLLIALASTFVATSEAAQEKLKALFLLVPGFGIKAADTQTRVLASPLAIRAAGVEGLITAVVAGPERTEVRLRIPGLAGRAGGPQLGSAGSDEHHEPAYLPNFPAVLVLPDGTRLRPYSMEHRFGQDGLTATLIFGKLPGGVDSVRLEVPSYFEIPLNLEAQIHLTPVDAAHYAEAQPVTGAFVRDGIKVEALQMAGDGDLIRFNLSVVPTVPYVTLDEDFRSVPWVSLTDNRGQAYPWNGKESDMFTGRKQVYSVAFAGPLPPGTESLTLTMEQLYIKDRGSAPLVLNVADMAVGDSRTLSQRRQVGAWPVVIKSVKRTADNQFTFTIDLGKPLGNRQLSHVRAMVGSNVSFVGWAENGQEVITVDIRPVDGEIAFTWVEPVVIVKGPWVIELPVK